MVPVSLFEFVGRYSYVFFCFVIVVCCNFSLVDYAFCQAVSRYRAFDGSLAVTCAGYVVCACVALCSVFSQSAVLIDKHFPTSHKLHKLFNRHTVRVSYSCAENMKNFIRKHNNRTLTKNTTQSHTSTNNVPRTCNCQRPVECPIPGNCLTKSVVYQAEVTTNDNDETKRYIGITYYGGAQLSRQNKISWQNKLNSRQNKLNSRQNKLNSRQNKLNSRQNKLNSRKTNSTHGKNKLNSRQNKLNSRQKTENP